MEDDIDIFMFNIYFIFQVRGYIRRLNNIHPYNINGDTSRIYLSPTKCIVTILCENFMHSYY